MFEDWPLIGRERELRAIAEARGDAACRGVAVFAPAGAGKSRLAREALAAAERDGALVAWVQATRSAATVPLAAVADLVPDEVRSDDVVQLIRRCGESLRERAGRRPIVLGVDDAQLLDPISAALILHLASTATAFVLATLREGEDPPDAIVSLWKDAGARRLELGDLGDEDVRALVEAALGDPVEEAAQRWVTDVGRGNPLYVRELVDGAREAGTLEHVAGFWRLNGEPVASHSLIELVEHRLAGLSGEQRAAVELLALGEPLRPDELERLTSADALLEAEARGLLELRGAELMLTHPLYGEAVRRALPSLRARSLRTRLAATLAERAPLTPDDALRVARLQLDAGGELDDELALEAARAANRAGDPDLGARLAERVDGLPAALLLAQAHTMRNRHADAEAVLAAAEPLAPGSPDAAEYLRRRVSVLHWGLHRTDALAALLDRARAWEGVSATLIERLRGSYGAMSAGVGAVDIAAEISGDARVGDEQRRSAAALHIMSTFVAGRDDAAARAWAARPAVPLRDSGDSAALAVLSVVAVETGNGWAELERYMAGALRDGVRVHDHDAAGIAALTLARLHFMRGRHHDATRWLAEAEVNLLRQDPYGAIVALHTLAVGIAYFTRDLAGADAALGRMHATLEGRLPPPQQQIHIRRAEGWALRLRSDADAGRQLLEDAAAFGELPGLAASLAYEALRAGAIAAPALQSFAQRCDSRMVRAYAAHAAARASRDGAALFDAAETFAAIGALRYAVEASSEAAIAFLDEGRLDSARRAAHRAQELHPSGQGGELPRIDGLDSTAIALTAREAQLAELASAGLSNAEIADRLVLSVRTVETHLYRAMQKLGISDRRDL